MAGLIICTGPLTLPFIRLHFTGLGKLEPLKGDLTGWWSPAVSPDRTGW